jgi:tRNA A58 N-methylase Trm61
VETGTWHGFTATAMGRGMQNNGFGKLITLELDRESYEFARNKIAEEHLESYVKVLHLHSLEYVPDDKIDFLLLDSELDTREKEFHHFAPYLNHNAYVIFHDVSEKHKIVREAINRLLALDNLHGFIIPSPRGLAVFQYQPRHESMDSVMERLQQRLSRADESAEALIAAFEDKENPVSDQEIEILNLNIAQAIDDGDDVLADTLSKLVEIAYQSRRKK